MILSTYDMKRVGPMINKTIDRAIVVATSAVTWIAAAVGVLQFVLAQDVVGDIPNAPQYIAQAIGFLTGAIAVIRRVTPVPSEARGVLPE